jgi:MraZ protein
MQRQKRGFRSDFDPSRVDMFIGTYRLFMEAERSLVVPPEFQAQLAQGACITRGFEQDLLLMSEQVFQEKCRRIASLNMADPSVRLLNRLILSNASRLEMDASGRLSIPAGLAAFAGLQKEIVLIGQGDYIEAWAPSTWEQQSGILMNVVANSDRFAHLDLTLAQE